MTQPYKRQACRILRNHLGQPARTLSRTLKKEVIMQHLNDFGYKDIIIK